MIINVTLSFEFDENFEYAPAAIANHLAEKLRNEEYQHRNCCISALMPEGIEPFIQELTVDCEDAVATINGYQLGDVRYAPLQGEEDDDSTVVVWQGVGRISRQQLADFYEVPVNTIDTNYQRHKDEFDGDGVEVLRGNDLRDARLIMSLASKSSQETVYTPAGALRMGFILRDSDVAKTVRTAAIRFIQGVGQQVSVLCDSNRSIVAKIATPSWDAKVRVKSRRFGTAKVSASRGYS